MCIITINGLFIYLCVCVSFNVFLPYLEIGVLQKRYNEMTIPHEEDIATYYKLRQQLDKLGKEMQQFIVMPKYCVPFLQPGRMVKVGV